MNLEFEIPSSFLFWLWWRELLASAILLAIPVVLSIWYACTSSSRCVSSQQEDMRSSFNGLRLAQDLSGNAEHSR